MATITETFNTADSSTVGGDNTWVETGGSQLKIAGNTLVLRDGNSGESGAYISSATLDGGDQYAQATLTEFAGLDGGALALGPRVRDPGTGANTGYTIWPVAAGASNLYWDLVKVVAGSGSILGTWATDPVVGDVMKVTVTTSGANAIVKGYVNGVERISYTDTSPISASNHNVGVRGYKDLVGTPSNAGLDSFEAGDLVTAGLSPSVNDTVTVAESITVNVVRCPSVNDATTVSEAITLNVILAPSVSDATTITESVTSLLVTHLKPSVSDTTTLTDVVTPILGQLLASVDDAVTLAESVTLSLTVSHAINVYEDVGLSKLIAQSDTITVTDVPTVAPGGVIVTASAFSSTTPNDFVNVSLTAGTTILIDLGEDVGLSLLLGFSDVIMVQDLATITQGEDVPTAAQFDTVTVSDFGPGVAIQGGPGAAIVIVTADTIGLVIMLPTSDSLTVTESVTGFVGTIITRTINVFDLVPLSEFSTTLVADFVFIEEFWNLFFSAWNAEVSDSVTVVDVPGLFFLSDASLVQMAIIDNVVVDETITMFPLFAMIGVDSITLQDIVNVGLPMQPQPHESITVADVGILFNPVLTVSKAESVTVVESVTGQPRSLQFMVTDSLTVFDSGDLRRPLIIWVPPSINVVGWDAARSLTDQWETGATIRTTWQAPSGAMAFTPTSLAGLAAWYAARQIVGNDGDFVGTWTDMSGNSRTLTQATGHLQPLYKTNQINGQPALLFDGVDDTLTRAAIWTGTSSVTLFMVVKPTAVGMLISQGAGTGRLWVMMGTNTGTTAVQINSFFGISPNTDNYSTGTTPIVGAARLVTAVFDRTTPRQHIAVNGTPEAETVPQYGSFAWDSSSAFALADGTNGVYAGLLAELLVYTEALSATDRQLVETYLNGQYALY